MQDVKSIFSIQNEREFLTKALEVFQFQATENPVYRTFIEHLGVAIEDVKTLEQIPFLPIKFFKQYDIVTGNQPAEKIFTSSGTTGMTTSRHLVSD